MKNSTKLLTALSAVLLLTFVSLTMSYSQDTNKNIVHGSNFVDENGDGYNDNAPDHDGDGIPNGQDPDYQRQGAGNNKGYRFIDENGDGVCDRFQDADGDGIPNYQDSDWVRPQDGTGKKYGKMNGKGMGRGGRGFRSSGRGLGSCRTTIVDSPVKSDQTK